MRMHDLDDFTRAYVEAILWAETDDEENQLQNNYEVADFEFQSMNDIIEECKQFQLNNWDHIQNNLSDAGHDFWMTRHGHGVGFWDGDWPDPAGDILTKACKEMGEAYVSEDGAGNLTYQSSWLNKFRASLLLPPVAAIPVGGKRYIDI